MTPDDVRLTAHLVAAGRVHSVSDDAVAALARRVLELEGEVGRWVIAANQYRFHQTTEAAVAAEREACAKLAEVCAHDFVAERRGPVVRLIEAIRARGAK